MSYFPYLQITKDIDYYFFVPQSLFQEMSNQTMSRECRICLESKGDMISPCECKGMLQEVHEDCLKSWIASILEKYPERIITSKNGTKLFQCELCHSLVSFEKYQRSKIACQSFEEMKNNGDYFCLIALILALLIWEVLSLAIILTLISRNKADPLTLIIFMLIMVTPFPFFICFFLKRKKYIEIELNGISLQAVSENQLETIEINF